MAGTGPGDLLLLAEDYLQAVVEALDTIPGSPDLAPGFVGSPERAFIVYGTPAADCPQLSVHAVPLTEGRQAPGPAKSSTFRVNEVTLVATLFRCVPAGDSHSAPSVDEIELAAQQVFADRWAMWNYTWNKVNAHLLFEKCGDVFNWQLDQVPPSGATVGSRLSVTVSLDGYDSVFGT